MPRRNHSEQTRNVYHQHGEFEKIYAELKKSWREYLQTLTPIERHNYKKAENHG